MAPSNNATPELKIPLPIPPVPFNEIVPSTVCTIAGLSTRIPKRADPVPEVAPLPVTVTLPLVVLMDEAPSKKAPLLLFPEPFPFPIMLIAPVVLETVPSDTQIPLLS